jgi:phage tail-like protein
MPAPRPITTFNFKIHLRLPGARASLCEADFAECDGLEMSVSPKTIREGGNNGQVIHLPGPMSYGQLSLKRGMTGSYDLWGWFERSQRERSLRASGEVIMLGSDRSQRLRFELTGCLPIKLKAPGLNAKDGQIAIEEMQIAYETLRLASPTA